MNRKHCRGITLIEVLVTVVILAFGLLGLASMQANSLKNNHSAFLRSQATYIAYEMFDRMRANRTVAIDSGSYNIAMTDSAPTSAGSTVASGDLFIFFTALSNLPEGDGAIACDTGTNICTVQVQWNDTRAPDDTQTFDMSAEL